ncbi:MAG: TraR/DksA family transcriptional regulator [Planctomycetota bacterium]
MRPTPLSDDQIEDLRQAMLQRRREIVGDYEDLRQEAPGGNQEEATLISKAPTHPADMAADDSSRSTDKQVGQTERDLVAEIDEALRRIEAGTYGRCDECGEPIDLERLKARPWSRLCLAHAEQLKG